MNYHPQFSAHDLITLDGKILSIGKIDEKHYRAVVIIENISPRFLGFSLGQGKVLFNLKSTLAQLGVNGVGKEYELSPSKREARVIVELEAIDDIGITLLAHLHPHAYIGKLFAIDERRWIRSTTYLARMLKRADRDGIPLFSLGESKTPRWTLEKVEGRVVAFLPLKKGIQTYAKEIHTIIPLFAKALKCPGMRIRELLRLLQCWKNRKKMVADNLLLVNTLPLYIRIAFGHVVNELLPRGMRHTTASILDPETRASGDIYEIYGSSKEELHAIPLEFYALHPYREHLFFSDQTPLQTSIKNPEILFHAMESAPAPLHRQCATFVVKMDQLLNLTPSEWLQDQLPGASRRKEAPPETADVGKVAPPTTHPAYPYLKAIQEGLITSQGVLLSRFFPSPGLKGILLDERVHRCLKGIYFQHPQSSCDTYFSREDRSTLSDLTKCGIPVFWLDGCNHQLLRYTPKPGRNFGMFVPLPLAKRFMQSTVIGIYGSQCPVGDAHFFMRKLLQGLIHLKRTSAHPLLNPKTPLALITGGGKGEILHIGNRVAKELDILSCAHILDMDGEGRCTKHLHTPYVDAKMTYSYANSLDSQTEFYADLPIFFQGGSSIDFGCVVEGARRKLEGHPPTPILLVGDSRYWEGKVSYRLSCDGTSKGLEQSTQMTHCYFCIQNAEQGVRVCEKFFSKHPSSTDSSGNRCD